MTFPIPTFKTIPAKKLVGKSLPMSYVANRTAELWRSFMPVRKEIRNVVSSNLFSMQVYGAEYDFRSFNPHTTFTKWAAAEVDDFNIVPPGMEPFELPGGLYAVFPFKGAASQGGLMFQYIFGTWLPASGYTVDARPHFELLGEKYKNDSPDSEEEFWVPVK